MSSCARNCGISIVIALNVVACSSPAKPLPVCNTVMTYKYPGDGSIGERYRGNRWWLINSENTPETAVERPDISDDFAAIDESFAIVDCSNANANCARTYQRVFAAPKGEIAAGTTFEIQGAKIAIEGCLRGEAERCTTALFISNCRRRDASSNSSVTPGEIVGGDCRKSPWGQQIMFIYDVERGVIAYESADWWKPGTDTSRWDLSTLGVSAGLMSLVESKGLLSCQIP
jgi:hypothetical protein